MKITPEILINTLKEKNYKLFDDDSKPFNLNLIGIRTADNTVNTFNDYFCVMYKHGGVWKLYAFDCTTDPGLYWLQNPMNVNGTAILTEGQHLRMLGIGKHKGYTALVQMKPVKVIRDFNRNNKIDYNSLKYEMGVFGINVHRANKTKKSKQIDKWSAGCQVIADPVDFDHLIYLCQTSATYWGNSFSYTLLNEKELIMP